MTAEEFDRERFEEGYEMTIVKRRVNAILNKITLQKFDRLYEPFVEQLRQLAHQPESLDALVSIVCDHALAAPRFAPIYARLCGHACGHEEPFQIMFRSSLLLTCSENLDLNHLASNAQRHTYFGYVRFWAELFRREIVEPSAVHTLVESLLEHNTNVLCLEALCKLLSILGQDMERDGSGERLDIYFSLIEHVAASHSISKRMRFMLVDLVELRDRGWVPRRGNDDSVLVRVRVCSRTRESGRKMQSKAY